MQECSNVLDSLCAQYGEITSDAIASSEGVGLCDEPMGALRKVPPRNALFEGCWLVKIDQERRLSGFDIIPCCWLLDKFDNFLLFSFKLCNDPQTNCRNYLER